jgi:hypothetical protein
VSLVQVAGLYHKFQYVLFDTTHVYRAILFVAAFSIFSIAFLVAPFSFGYFLGFYLYTIVASYLWLVQFSRFGYDHTSASFSAFMSALAFLVPALFVKSAFKQRLALSERTLDILLYTVLVLSAATIAIGAYYNFQLVDLSEINALREKIQFPVPLRYAIGALSTVLLPFAFACFVARNRRWWAGMTLALLLLFYPVTLTKLTLAAPLWLLFLLLLSKLRDVRTAVILSLLVPAFVGVVLMGLFDARVLTQGWPVEYFGTVNFRMLAVPAMALDYYNDFFATHPYTYFCQVNLLKRLVDCPYTDALWVLMADRYHLGNLNASLFATEGIASVGPALAPVSALACGLVMALGNRASANLPARFILLSCSILVQILVNVPLTIALITNGGALLFLLWYVTPRTIFDEK